MNIYSCISPYSLFFSLCLPSSPSLSLPLPPSLCLLPCVSLFPSLPLLFLALSLPSLYSLSYECLSAKPHYTGAFCLDSDRSSPIITKKDQSIIPIPLLLSLLLYLLDIPLYLVLWPRKSTGCLYLPAPSSNFLSARVTGSDGLSTPSSWSLGASLALAHSKVLFSGWGTFPSKGLGKLHYWNSDNYLIAFSVSNKPGFQDCILTQELRKSSFETQSWWVTSLILSVSQP